MIIYQHIYRNNNPGILDMIVGSILITVGCCWAVVMSIFSILDALGLMDDVIIIIEGIKIGWAAYATPWKAHSFNAFFGWYFAGFTMLFLLILALWVLILPLRFFDITVPFKPIFITALILSIIPLTIWICCGLGYWYWFMPPA